MSTLWFDVPQYDDRYQIEQSGQVRSKRRHVNSPICGGKRLIGGRVLKPQLVKGYPAIQAMINGVRRTIYVHRMLAETFIPNPEGKPCINHIDGNKANNAIDNLEWCTHQENMDHAYRNGLVQPVQSGPGEMSGAAKLCNEKVRVIKRRLKAGHRQSDIAQDYGVAKGTIGFIARGETWSHITI